MRAADLAARVTGVEPRGDGWVALCPAHDDHKASLTFRDGEKGVILKCRAGCQTEVVCERIGLHLRDLFFEPTPSNGQPNRRIVKTYDYHDAAGVLLYQAVRYEPKDFRQRRPDGFDDWIWNLDDVRRVLYRLPKLTGQATVFLVEGEKDADRLWALGLSSTTNAGGAAKWSQDLTAQLKTAGVHEVIALPDNDEPGRKHAQSVARSCVAAGLVAKIITLPNLPPKGDVSDFLDAGGTLDELHALVQAAMPWIPDTQPDVPTVETGEQSQDDRPELDCDIGDLDEITRQAWDAIQTGNTPPQLFLYGSVASRIELDEDGTSLRIVELTPDRLRHHAAILARWTKRKPVHFRQKEDAPPVECRPPIDVVKNMLAAPQIPLPVLSRIVEVPVFSDRGNLVQRPGYDGEARLFYQPYDPAMPPMSVPAEPTADEVATAKAILDDLISDFPLVSPADCTHTIALAIVPFVRDLIDGPVPLHVTEAPCPGSGKNLLVEVVLHPSVGARIGAIAEARDDDEWRKRLTARLREGCPITLIDNLSRPLDSGTVSAVLTARRWEDRLLGKSETIAVPVRTIFVCTANNPMLSMEIARRSIRIRLDPKMDRPWLRDGFRHPDLRTFVEQKRPALIVALLTLVQAWLKAGRPKPAAKPLGSFEAWSTIVGGIVEHAGYTQFLGNALEFYEAADTEGAIWRLFVTSWWDTYQGQTVSAKDLFDIATGIDGFYLGRGSSERGQRTVLGQSIRKHRDQIVGGFRVQDAGTYGNGAQWRLQQIATLVFGVESVEDVENITLV